MDKKEKIGGVTLDYEFYDESQVYSDGDEVETEIVDIFKENKNVIDILIVDNRWAILYHLSPQRANIVEPMEISTDDEVLELGAGFGAITSAIAPKAKYVDCVELSKRRSLGNAYRNKDCENVTIYVGNFEKIEFRKLYDVVVMIGVLEYAGHYLPLADEPYPEFLQKVKTLLKPNGKVYVAIENRLGMKYFSGAPEDHLGTPYTGIEGYIDSPMKVKTFSRSDLEALLITNGFRDVFFYYPLPDYKLPTVIYSDKYVPRKGELLPEFPAYDRPRVSAFSEYNAMLSLVGTEEFKVFSNSFLVEAIKA
ncbi:hypothetical protein AGMMS49942_21570 [Spirochaetia bacterium]|nr:hypothetical protein AGMMS49942_21570 [Spirochaetia bacterium]